MPRRRARNTFREARRARRWNENKSRTCVVSRLEVTGSIPASKSSSPSRRLRSIPSHRQRVAYIHERTHFTRARSRVHTSRTPRRVASVTPPLASSPRARLRVVSGARAPAASSKRLRLRRLVVRLAHPSSHGLRRWRPCPARRRGTCTRRRRAPRFSSRTPDTPPGARPRPLARDVLLPAACLVHHLHLSTASVSLGKSVVVSPELSLYADANFSVGARKHV